MRLKARLNLSTKIFLLASLNLLLIGVVLTVFMRVQYRLDLQSFLLSPARDRILAVGRQLALELRDTDPANWNALLARYAKTNKVELHLVDDDGLQVAGSSQPLPQRILETLQEQSHHTHSSPLTFLGTTSEPTRHWVGVRIPIPSSGEHRHVHGALVAASSSLIATPFFFDPKPWLAVAAAVVLLSLLCWFPFVRRLTRTVSYVSRATGQIAEGQFKIQLPVARHDEIGELSASINRMATRLDGYVTGQRRFLGDTAHELCSPIARMQVAVGILERTEDNVQRQVISDLRDDLQQMSALVNDVLSFSKAGMQVAKPSMVSVNVAEIVRRVVDRESTNGASIIVDVPETVRVMADADLLERALSNVTRNAIRYAGHAGPIEIAANCRNGKTSILVRDHGPGLPEEELQAVFEPFYRPEFARGRDTGGVGLGLAIVKSCIESCEGSVACRNRPTGGLDVEMSLQSAPPSQSHK